MRSGRWLLATLWVFVSLAAASTAVAQNPFVGTWKLNQEKSQMAGDIMKFGPAAGDAIELSGGGITYSFRVDGKPYALPSGHVAIWRETSADSWTTEYRNIDGKLLSSDNWKLSSDGKNLTVTTSGVKANGDLYTDTEDYVRTAGSDGLMGAWKSTSVKLSSPNELTIQESGLDGLILKIAAIKATAVTNFNGKEVAVEGPDIPTGLRLALTRTGPYKFRLVQKLNGSVVESVRIHRGRRRPDHDRGRRGTRGSPGHHRLGEASGHHFGCAGGSSPRFARDSVAGSTLVIVH